MMIKKAAFYFATLLALLLVLVSLNVQYSRDALAEYEGILLDASSMVFTIMGIWIAFLYPNALQRIVDPTIQTADFTESLNETKRLESLVATVLRSALIVTLVMLGRLLGILFGQTEFYADHSMLINAFHLSGITVLSILQAESIAYVAISNVLFINDLHSRREDRTADQDI